MYQAAVTIEIDHVGAGPSEKERCARLDGFLTAVSSGWPQVMVFLESCSLDDEARALLCELRSCDHESTWGGACHATFKAA